MQKSLLFCTVLCNFAAYHGEKYTFLHSMRSRILKAVQKSIFFLHSKFQVCGNQQLFSLILFLSVILLFISFCKFLNSHNFVSFMWLTINEGHIPSSKSRVWLKFISVYIYIHDFRMAHFVSRCGEKVCFFNGIFEKTPWNEKHYEVKEGRNRALPNIDQRCDLFYDCRVGRVFCCFTLSIRVSHALWHWQAWQSRRKCY